MSTAAAFIPLIHGQLAELKKICGNIFHRPVRESIANTENYIQNLNTSNNQIDFQVALEPFFKAVKDGNDLKFLPTVLDCFYNVFHQSTKDIFLNRQLTQSVITILAELLDSHSRGNSDEVNLRCCNVCIACLRSYSGIHYVHGKLLKKLFMLLFQIYNDSENPNTLNSISTSINESLTALFDSYETPPEVPTGSKTIEELSSNVADGLFQNADQIIYYLEPVLKNGNYSSSIRDVDVYVVLALLSKIVEQNKLQLRTIILASNILASALQNNSKFYTTPAFNLVLNTKIHIAAMSLALDPRMPLAKVTAELIITLWERFAPMYFENLNELLVKGICQSLFSPEKVLLIRSLSVFNVLATKPQLFVDAFVNYDCDDTGNFKNTFEDTINRLVTISFPDSVQTEVQRNALEVIVHVLKSLWSYFIDPHPSDSNDSQPEAPQNFLDAKKTKNVFNVGLDIFKNSWKKGLKYFIENKFCEDTPSSIAKFLYNTPALSPSQIGEIIGNVDRVDVLKEFIKNFDFKGVTFEAAFRSFLSKFQIPGEAQQIDRVMEQFGTKYYNDNPNMFSCADTVYVLAFSTLMLHTDAHHPNVTSRMTLQEFIRNNKGIDNGKDLPPDFLEDLYNGITKKKIFVSSTEDIVSGNTTLLNRKQRAEMFRSQCKHTLMAARERIVSTQQSKVFHKSVSPLFIGPMFRAIWGGALGTLTMTFEQTDRKNIYTLCLEGLTYAVHIASHCFIDDALDTLVDSFAKFTALRKNLSEVFPKNLDCTNALLNLAITDGNFLRNAWPIVLGEISAIDKLAQTKEARQFPQIDDIFSTASQKLDRESILDFVQAMCDVSRQELAEKPPRNSTCQKLVIVTHFNLEREHFIWTKIWKIIGNYLKYVGSASSFQVSTIVIDILKQLANKFLEQKELVEYHFQERFMAPFYDIFEAQKDINTQLLILMCIQQLIERDGKMIQSGWKTIINILSSASIISETQKSCFGTITYLTDNLLPILSNHYVDLMSIISSFIHESPDDLRLAAVPLLSKIASNLVLKDEMTKDEIEQWLTLFKTLKNASIEDSSMVRGSAHAILINVLKAAIPQKPIIQSNITSEVLTDLLPVTFLGQGEETPDFYKQSAPILTEFYSEVLKPNWEGYFLPNCDAFYPLIIKLFEDCSCSIDPVLQKTGLENYQNFVNDSFSSLNEQQRIDMTNSFTNISEHLFKDYSLSNSIRFIKLIENNVSVCVQNNDKNVSNKFIDILYQINDRAEKLDSHQFKHQIWSLTRSTILKCLLNYNEDELERINETVYKTVSTFVDIKCATNLDEKSAVSWNENLFVTLQLLNKMNQNMFAVCFKKSSMLIVDMATAKSIDVRKQIKISLKRKLLYNNDLVKSE